MTDLEATGFEKFRTAGYNLQKSGRDERLNRNLKNAMRTSLIHAGFLLSLWVSCFYAVCDAHRNIVNEGCIKTPEELLTGVKPSVAHLRTLSCQVWAQVTDKMRMALEAKASPEILRCSLSSGRYRMMIEDYRSVETTSPCLVREAQLPIYPIGQIWSG